MQPYFEAVIFDLDKTLIESGEAYEHAITHQCTHHGLHLSREEYRENSNRPLEHWLTEKGLPLSEVETFIDGYRRVLSNQLLEMAQWLPGAKESLRLLQTKKMKSAIVTNARKIAVEAVNTRLDLLSLVPFAITKDDVGTDRVKPHPHGLQDAMKRLDIRDPERCLYVGDHLDDMRAATAAGMLGCLLVNDDTSREAMESAVFCITDHAQVHSQLLRG